MSEVDRHSPQRSGAGPSPAALAARAAARTGEPADHPRLIDAATLIEEAAMVREMADEDGDLAALARQAELLSAAHDRLAQALEDAGRG